MLSYISLIYRVAPVLADKIVCNKCRSTIMLLIKENRGKKSLTLSKCIKWYLSMECKKPSFGRQ